jgi:FKBP-type peptidyl-prolyl cis-trans isomerase FkpA
MGHRPSDAELRARLMAPAAVPVAIVAGLLIAARTFGEQPADPQAATQPAPPPPEAALLVTDLVKGIGDEAFPGMNVIVHYTGWLYDPGAKDFRGKQFDSSRERGQPLSFPLGAGRVIRGWEQGIPGMKIGGTRRLVIPPGLAYGSRNVGNGAIPPNSTLLFEVELLAVESITLKTDQ